MDNKKIIVDRVDPNIINQINNIPIFNIQNVRGYCIIYENNIKTFVYAEDIAREGGLVSKSKGRYAGCATSCTTDVPIYDSIRWDYFNDYVNDVIDSFKRINPEVLYWLQLPIHRYSYIPLEIALSVLMKLRSKKARDFQVILSSIIAPQIQSNAIKEYNNKIKYIQEQMKYQQDQYQTQIEDQKEQIQHQDYQIDEHKRKMKQLENMVWDIKFRTEEAYEEITKFKDYIGGFDNSDIY